MADSNLNVNINGRDNLSPVVQQLESKLIRTVGAISSAFAAIKIGAFPITAATEFQKELVNVQKTTEFTANGIRQLGDELKTLSLRMNVSTIDLVKIAAAAGQQGLGKEGVEGIRQFTESVSRMAGVLDITADAAATDVGKLLNVFRLSVNEVENIGSAFNQVSNASNANGEQLLNVVKRIGDAAGTINLQESLGLAATGIDFGVSPEVVGTSYSKIFADMRAKAKEFANVMEMTTEGWIGLIDNEGGIAAYKAYLSKLRKLDSVEQARVISELNGRGRIFALVNKNVQDTQNAVLNRNLENAMQGFKTGTSAIREQEKVLGTLASQVQIFKNSVFALGTDAGDRLLKPLTTYIAQLSAALQAPAVISFVEAIGSSMLDLVEAIATATKFLASLNVNWENLITVAKIFIGLKVVNAGFALLSGSLARAAGSFGGYISSANLAAAASTNAANAANGGAQVQISAFARQQAAFQAYRASLVARVQAEAAHATAVEAARARQIVADRAAAVASSAAARNAVASAAAQAAAANVNTVRRVTTGAIDGAVAAQNAKIQAATARHQATLAAIEADFRGKRTVADIANKNALIQAETAHHARQITGYNTYYNRRIALDRANSVQLIANAEATAARLLGIQTRSAGAAAAGAAAAARAQAGLAATGAAAQTAAAQLAAQQLATQNASRALFSFSGIMAATAGVMRTAIGVLGKLFFWVTIVYLALDAFGVLEKLPAFFAKLTDKLGLTSEATRKQAEESKRLAAAVQKETDKVKELVDAYQELKDNKGNLKETQIDGLEADFQGESAARDKAAKLLADSLRAASAELETLNSKKIELNFEDVKIQDALLGTAEALKKLQAEKIAMENLPTKSNWREETARLNTEIAETQKAHEDLTQIIKDRAVVSKETYDADIKQAEGNRNRLQSVVKGLFTKDSAGLFIDYIKAISDENAAAAKLQQSLQEDMQAKIAADKGNSVGAIAAANVKIAETQAKLDTSRAKAAELKKEFEGIRNLMVKNGGLTQPVIDSLLALDTFFGKSTTVIDGFATAIKNIQGSGDVFNGSLAKPPLSTDSSGTEKVDPAESEMRKQGRALLDIRKAQADAELSVLKARNDRELTIYEDLYDRGLLSISEYYANRRAIQLKNSDATIKNAQAEVAALANERDIRAGEGAEKSVLLGLNAQIASAQGRVNLLREERKQIGTQIDIDTDRARKAFNERVFSTLQEVTETLGTENLQKFISQKLEGYKKQTEEIVNQIEREGGAQAQSKIDGINKANELKSLKDGFAKAGEATRAADADMSNYQGSLERLRDAGKITALEYERAMNDARAVLAEQVAAQITVQEGLLESMERVGGRGTDAYKALAIEIGNAKNELADLRVKSDEVAAAINGSLKSGLQQALKDVFAGPQARELTEVQQRIKTDNIANVNRLKENIAFLQRARDGVLQGYSDQQGNVDAQIAKNRSEISNMEAEINRIQADANESVFESILRAAKTLAVSVAETIQEQINKNLAEQAVQFLGGLEGGIGGFVSGLLGAGEKGTKNNPMITKDVNDTAGGKATDPIGTLFDTFKTKLTDTFGGLGTTISDIFLDVGDNIGSVLNSILDSIFGKGGGEGGYIGQIGSFLGSFFHTGGVVGATYNTRLMHPAMFTNAMRYHSGGIAGLQPNEVPAILQRGEEVLTRNDPRHVGNGGGGGTSVEVNVNVESGQSSTISDSANAKELGKRISAAVQQEIAVQKRPGGLLA